MRVIRALVPAAVVVLGACAHRRHHHYIDKLGPRTFRTVEFRPAPADVVGYGVVAPSDEYPLATCVVSGEPLRPSGSPVRRMDGPMAVVYDGTELQFCCSACIAEFRQEPSRYVARVRSAAR